MAETKTTDEPVITAEFLEASRLRHETETRNPKSRHEPIPTYTSAGRTYIGLGKSCTQFAKPGQVDVETVMAAVN